MMRFAVQNLFPLNIVCTETYLKVLAFDDNRNSLYTNYLYYLYYQRFLLSKPAVRFDVFYPIRTIKGFRYVLLCMRRICKGGRQFYCDAWVIFCNKLNRSFFRIRLIHLQTQVS